jgi:hypothetical protein
MAWVNDFLGAITAGYGGEATQEAAAGVRSPAARRKSHESAERTLKAAGF